MTRQPTETPIALEPGITQVMTIGERTFVVGTLPPDHSDGTGLVLASMTVRGGGTLARKSKLDGSRIG